MRVLDLFSGIGGFSLGLERAGMTTVAFCEIEPFCRAVLGKHWPGVPIYDDVRDLTAARLRDDGIGVDVICGGFPCQDISSAGQRAGIDGERSGLWSQYARIVGELRPRYVIVENVAALLGRGLERVLGDLAAIGYDAEWHCIPAAAVGAPHRRDRVWIMAYPDGSERGSEPEGRNVAYGHDAGWKEASGRSAAYGSNGGAGVVADTDGPRLEGWLREVLRERAGQLLAWQGRSLSDANGQSQHAGAVDAEVERAPEPFIGSGWLAEPDVGRVADGIPARMDRLRSLGNAVVPQIPEIIGRAIMSASLAA